MHVKDWGMTLNRRLLSRVLREGRGNAGECSGMMTSSKTSKLSNQAENWYPSQFRVENSKIKGSRAFHRSVRQSPRTGVIGVLTLRRGAKRGAKRGDKRGDPTNLPNLLLTN